VRLKDLSVFVCWADSVYIHGLQVDSSIKDLLDETKGGAVRNTVEVFLKVVV